MKIVVTATIPSLDGSVDPRFGRCPRANANSVEIRQVPNCPRLS